MKALMIVADGVQCIEAEYPRYRLDEAGYSLDVASMDGKDVHGIGGMLVRVNATAHTNLIDVTNYDALILPGGAKAMEKLRQDQSLLNFIANFQGVIGSMCSAAHLLISAKIVKGRRISGYYALKDDIENAGATFVDAPFVTDGNITSSPHYKYLGPWMAEVLRQASIRQAYIDARQDTAA